MFVCKVDFGEGGKTATNHTYGGGRVLACKKSSISCIKKCLDY